MAKTGIARQKYRRCDVVMGHLGKCRATRRADTPAARVIELRPGYPLCGSRRNNQTGVQEHPIGFTMQLAPSTVKAPWERGESDDRNRTRLAGEKPRAD